MLFALQQFLAEAWFFREGGIVLSWWALVTLAGVAVMPLCMRLTAALPDHGYTLARTVGLLLVGFVFWSLGIFGFLRNQPGGLVLAWLLVLIGSLTAYYTFPGERPSWGSLWRNNGAAIITAEVVFITLLLGWALFRASHPSLVATEKPMELAFISSVQRSEVFPPNDPWMSGYAISYYHFGYVMAGSLATLSGINSAVGFNMMIALLFALTGLNTFGVVYNLICSLGERIKTASTAPIIAVSLLGASFVIFMGNFQLPLIELPYQSGTASAAYLDFWDVQDREMPQTATFDDFSDEETTNFLGLQLRDPARWNFWWWFRASRVINDRHLPNPAAGDTVGQPVGANVIDEFPQFSFILADVHPHVLALPFTVMTIGIALSLVLSSRAPSIIETLFYGLLVGGLMFLNIWDGPIYLVVLTGAEGLRRLVQRDGQLLKGDDVARTLLFSLSLVGIAFVMYLPFFLSFRSQASGILPNLEFPTLFRQYFIMFGPFILMLTPYLAFELWRGRHQLNWRAGLAAGAVIFVTLLAVMLFLTAAGYTVPSFRDTVLRFVGERGGWGTVIPLLLERRLANGLTTVVLLVVLAVIVARLLPRSANTTTLPYTPATGFALFIIACGTGLTLIPEFVYLRDNFGVRINTIFKFYYQAWVMFAIGSAYGLYTILAHPKLDVDRFWFRIALAPLLIVSLVLGMMYPALGIHNRALVESGRLNATDAPLRTLDGGPSLVSEDDYAAIMCLAEQVEGDDVVVAEAIGPAYRNQFGRVGVLTGIPIVLGWEGHQRQWRGSTYPQVAGTRRQDVEQLYNDVRWETAAEIIERYDIDYIFYGTTERQGTGEVDPFNPAGEDKFVENLEVVCEYGDSLFYRVTPRSLQIAGVDS